MLNRVKELTERADCLMRINERFQLDIEIEKRMGKEGMVRYYEKRVEDNRKEIEIVRQMLNEENGN